MSTQAPPLIIPVQLDRSAAKASLKDLQASTKGAIKAIADEQDKSDQAYIRAIKKKLAAEKQLDAEKKRNIKSAQAEQDRADADYVKAVKKKLAAEKQLAAEKEAAAKKAQAEQDKADADYIRAVKANLAAEKQLEAQKLAAEKQLEAQKEAAAKKAQRDQDKADAAYIRAVRQKLRIEKELEDQQKKQAVAIDGGVSGMLKMVAAMGGLQSAQGIASAMADHFDKIRTDAFKAAEEVMRMRGAVRELQALRDEFGKTGAGVSHVMQGAAQTLQTPQEFQQMESAGLGVGELAIKNKKDRKEFGKFMVATGRMATQEGGDAGAYGQLGGQIALLQEGGLKSGAMEGQLNRMFQIQQPGGFRNMSQAAGQFSKNIGLAQNKIYTPQELMGLTSAFSVSNPEEAATKVQQFTRSMMAGRISARGMKVSDDVDLIRTSEYFKKLGIGENDSAIERGKKVSDDLAAQEAAAKAKGEKFNAYEYLMTHGFSNQEDRQAILEMSGLRNTGRLEKIEAAQNAPLKEGAITERFNEFRKTDKFAKARELEIAGQLTDTKKGFEEEPLVLAQRAAFERLKDQGKVTGTFEEWKNKGFFGRLADDNLFGGYHKQVNQEAARSLMAEQERLGKPSLDSFNALQTGDEESLRRSANQVNAAGGDLTRGTAELLNRAARNLVEATQRDAPPLAAPPPNPRVR